MYKYCHDITHFCLHSESRNQKRKEFVEAIIIRKEPVALAARVFSIPLRTAFNWLARYRNGGWQALNEKSKQGRPKKNFQVAENCEGTRNRRFAPKAGVRASAE